MVSKEYLRFFEKSYRDSSLRVDGLTLNQQRALRGKASTYLSRTKQQMKEDMEALATLASLLPEKHLAEVFTEENVDRLVSALLTSRESRKKSRKADPGRQGMIEREYRIAVILMEKGVAKCWERIDRNDVTLAYFIQPEAFRTILMLKYLATEEPGANLLTYDFDPNRYPQEKNEAPTSSTVSKPPD